MNQTRDKVARCCRCTRRARQDSRYCAKCEREIVMRDPEAPIAPPRRRS